MMRKKDVLKTPWWRLACGGVIALLVLAASISQVGFAEPLDLKALEAAAAQPSKHPKISGSLRQVEAALRQLRPVPNASRVNVSADGVRVYIHLVDHDERYLATLKERGARIEIAEPRLKILQARIPVGLLEAVAQYPFVRFIEAPERPDGALIFLDPGLGQRAGDLGDPMSFVSFLSSVETDPGASLAPTSVFSTAISGPPGQYLAFFWAMPQGAGPSGNLWSIGSGGSNGGSSFQGVAIAPFSVP